MTQRWSIGRLLTYAILLVVPALFSLVPTVFAVNRATLVDRRVDRHLDTAPESTATDSVDDFTRSFDVVAEVRPDRSVRVVETITQVFATERHGIERYIPYDYGEAGEHLISDLVVATSPGTPDDLEVTDASGAIRVRIGDADTTIVDAHTYRIEYTVEDVIVVDGDTALVPLDAVTDWAQPVDRFTYRVVGPTDPRGVACFVGATATCDDITSTAQGVEAVQNDLRAYDTFTVNVSYPTDAFDPTALRTPRTSSVRWSVVAIVLMYAGLAGAFIVSTRRARRDRSTAVSGLMSTFAGPMSADLPGRRAGTVPPPPPGSAVDLIPARYADDLVPIEFVPPVNLDPACLLRTKDGAEADVRRMLAGTLVDLAADGVIGLERRGDDWVVRRVDQPPRDVKPYEYTLLEALLGSDKSEQVLSTRVDELSTRTKTYVAQVDDHLRSLGLLGEDELPVTTGGRLSSFVRKLFVLGAMTFVSVFAIAVASSTSEPALPLGVHGVLIGGIVMSVALVSRTGDSKRFTPRGMATSLRARGFERFFRESEAVHAQAAERVGLMREYMGYAVALGCVDSWVRSMPSDSVSAWTGSGLADPMAFGSLYRQRVFQHSVTSAFTPAPSRSSGFGSGGFSGGGGGFGGGGGGSW